MMPLLPTIGSIRIAATRRGSSYPRTSSRCSSARFVSSFGSFVENGLRYGYGAKKRTTPGTPGSAGQRRFSPVSETAPVLEPWNERYAVITFVRPLVMRMILLASSSASAPPVVKNTRPPFGQPTSCTKRSASSERLSFAQPGGENARRSACSPIAFARPACPCPRLTATKPAVISMYSLPSASTSVEPCARTMTGGRAAFCATHGESTYLACLSTSVSDAASMGDLQRGRSALEHLGDQPCGPLGPVGLYRPVARFAGELACDRFGDRLRGRVGVFHAATGAVALETVPHVEVLLEVVPQRNIDEGTPCCGQLHRRREATLHKRDVARAKMTVQLRNVRAHVQAVVRRQRCGIDPRTRNDDHAQLRH